MEDELAGAEGRGLPWVALRRGQTVQAGRLAHFNDRSAGVPPTASGRHPPAEWIANTLDTIPLHG